jgi:shikimate kinase
VAAGARAARLVVVVGPIASGKSTVAGLLTEHLIRAGLTVACVDVDEVAAMAHAPGGLTQEQWHQAHVAHGALVGGWLDTAVDVVVAHGPAYSRQETDALMAHVAPGTRVLRVLLLASLDAALQRVGGQPGRGVSRDPAFLRATYDRFWSLRPHLDPCDLSFDTEVDAAETVAARVADQLLVPRPSGGGQKAGPPSGQT